MSAARERKNLDSVRLSVVVPVYNEEACLAELHRRVARAAEIAGASLELILVDDGSTDGSLALIQSIAAADPRVWAQRLIRNTGSQRAILRGLRASTGDVVCTLDADLQHPPEHLPRMLDAWRAGFDIVEMVRARPAKDASARGLRGWLTPAFYRAFNLISPISLSPDSTDFRLLDRACVDALRDASGSSGELVRTLVARLDAPRATLDFEVPPRFAGRSRYDAFRLGRAAAQALWSAARARLDSRK